MDVKVFGQVYVKATSYHLKKKNSLANGVCHKSPEGAELGLQSFNHRPGYFLLRHQNIGFQDLETISLTGFEVIP